MKNICYIVGAGEFFGERIDSKEGDMIIAADGGLNHLLSMDIKPDIIIGDFDSLGEIPTSENVISLNPVKDDTDMHAGIAQGLKRGYKCFHIYAGTGGRTEHTIANIQNIAMLAKKGMQGYLFGNNEIMTVIHNNEIKFSAESKGYISAFSLSTQSIGVYEKGLKYPLENYKMKNDFPIGVSNEFIGVEGSICVKEGTLLLIYTKEAKEIR